MGQESMTRFAAVGDIVLSGRTAAAMARDGLGWPFERVRALLDKADLLFGNLECPLLPADFPVDLVDPRGIASFADGAGALRDAGFDVVNLANNHILDGGTIGLRHTASALRAEGVHPLGVGDTQDEAWQPVVLERHGRAWGFLGAADDSDWTLSTTGPSHAYFEPERMLSEIEALRGVADVIVVSVHTGL